MTAILVTGYKNVDLGIFSEKDPRVAIIKRAIRRDLIRLLENGVTWLIFTGNLGFEVWALEEAKHLVEDYGVKLATIFPFKTHGQNWNEANQAVLEQFKAVDFVKYSFESYQNPGQFRSYNQFLLDNTEGAYLFYDEAHETNLNYLVSQMRKQSDYELTVLTFEQLEDILSEEE